MSQGPSPNLSGRSENAGGLNVEFKCVLLVILNFRVQRDSNAVIGVAVSRVRTLAIPFFISFPDKYSYTFKPGVD